MQVDNFCHVHTDSVEDGEKLIQSALDAFGKIGECCPFITILCPSQFFIIKLSKLNYC